MYVIFKDIVDMKALCSCENEGCIMFIYYMFEGYCISIVALVQIPMVAIPGIGY